MHNHLDDMLMLMMMLVMMQRIIKATVPTQTNLSAFYCGELLLLQLHWKGDNDCIKLCRFFSC